MMQSPPTVEGYCCIGYTRSESDFIPSTDRVPNLGWLAIDPMQSFYRTPRTTRLGVPRDATHIIEAWVTKHDEDPYIVMYYRPLTPTELLVGVRGEVLK